jgi:single-stranded DNA-specific DHH superfamily exonuclease
MLGCLADWFIPDFSEEFARENPNVFTLTKDPAKALYETELGKIAKVLSFALKDRITAVVKMLKILINIKSIDELMKSDSKTNSIFKRFKQIDKKYSKLLEKAITLGKELEKKGKKLLFFQYGGQFSLSGELANEIYYNFLLVAYIKGTKVNCSIRGKIDVRSLVANAMQGIEGTSGGHKNACGASLGVEDLPKLKDNMIKLAK